MIDKRDEGFIYAGAVQNRVMRRVLLLVFSMFLCGCTGVPEGIEPVRGFELDRYLGKWYEIARLDHSFERGLTRVTAEYSLREDGGIRVVNSGYSAEDNEWSSAEGRGYFVRSTEEGYLKVSFFGPFYGSYVVFELGEDYEYSMVTSSDRSYLWLLSRTPTIDETVVDLFLKKSKAFGFDTDKLIFVDQE
jgi:apolipoprotein D and lipocalin family protein